MVNKQEIADSLQVGLNALLESIRYIHFSSSQEDNGVFRAPFACKVVSCVMRAETLESTNTSTTASLKKAASGTAISSGTDIITPVNVSSDLTAYTDYDCTVDTDNNILDAGDSVAVVIGTTSELAGFVCNITVERLN